MRCSRQPARPHRQIVDGGPDDRDCVRTEKAATPGLQLADDHAARRRTHHDGASEVRGKVRPCPRLPDHRWKTFVDLTHSFSPQRRCGRDSAKQDLPPPPIPRPRRPTPSPRTASARPSMRWSASTAPTSTRRPISRQNGDHHGQDPAQADDPAADRARRHALSRKDPNHAFSVADLMAWEKKHGRVPRGSFVALRTDMSKDLDSDPRTLQAQPVPGLGVRDHQVPV